MKKVKLMMTAIAVLAVVGGALAFKAKSFGAQIYCTTGTGNCDVPSALGFTVVQPNGVNSIASLSCTDLGHKDAQCVQTSIYPLN